VRAVSDKRPREGARRTRRAAPDNGRGDAGRLRWQAYERFQQQLIASAPVSSYRSASWQR